MSPQCHCSRVLGLAASPALASCCLHPSRSLPPNGRAAAAPAAGTQRWPRDCQSCPRDHTPACMRGASVGYFQCSPHTKEVCPICQAAWLSRLGSPKCQRAKQQQPLVSPIMMHAPVPSGSCKAAPAAQPVQARRSAQSVGLGLQAGRRSIRAVGRRMCSTHKSKACQVPDPGRHAPGWMFAAHSMAAGTWPAAGDRAPHWVVQSSRRASWPAHRTVAAGGGGSRAHRND